MIPTLDEIISMLLAGLCTHEQAAAWLQAHREMNERIPENAQQLTIYRGTVMLDSLQRMFEQDQRWGKGRTYPDFDHVLVADADTTPATLSTFYHLPSGKSLRKITEARADIGELTWFDVLLEEIGKLPEAYEDRAALRDRLLDVAAVALQWAQARTVIEVTLDTPLGPIKETVPDALIEEEVQTMVGAELSTFEVHFNGDRKEDILASDAREAGQMAHRFYGPGEYNIKLRNDTEDEGDE